MQRKTQISLPQKISYGLVLLMAFLFTAHVPAASSKAPFINTEHTNNMDVALVPGSHTITYFQGNKAGAVSFTFDDGYTSYLTIAIPQLNARGLKGTFFTVTHPDWINSSNHVPWAAWQSAVAQGHEVAAHTVNHMDLTTLSEGQMRSELSEAQFAITQNVPGQACASTSYPLTNSNPSIQAAAADYYDAARGGYLEAEEDYLNYYEAGSDSNGSWNAINFYNVGSRSGDDMMTNGEYFNELLNDAISRHAWFDIHFHNITNEEGFGDMLDYIQDKPGYWIDTFCNVARYMKERLNSTVQVVTDNSTEIKLNIVMSASLPVAVYNVPLTLRSTVPASWTQVKVQQGSSTQTLSPVTEGGDKVVYYNAIPNGGNVILTPPDTTAPETSINSQPASLDGDNTPSFTFSGNDGSGSGVASFMCKMDAGSYAACSSPYTSSALADGSHTFSVYAIDNASNADATPASYTWTIDTVAPTVSSIVRVGSSPTAAASVDFTITFSESVTGVGIGDFSLTTSGAIGTTLGGVSGSGATRTVSVNTGGNGTIRLDVPVSASITDTIGNALGSLPFTTGESYTVDKNTISLPSPSWSGAVSISSDKNVVAVGRPHIGAEVMTYDGFSSGSTTSYIPMLFKDAFGGSYDSAFYIQNVHASNTANITIKYYDSAGALSCTVNDTVLALASKGYWLPGVGCLSAGWTGGVVVSSDQPIVAIGRPHIGTEVMTYDGFTSGSTTSYIPMLFKDAFGGSYDSAFYVQNVHASNTANIAIKFYDSAGALSCTVNDTVLPFASKGYWVPAQSCLPVGWVGGVVVTSDQPIVGVGRPHIGDQVTTYNGFSAGVTSSYVPMLFKDAFGGSYDAAYYIQNVHATNTANLTIKYYDSAGNLTCTVNDTLLPLASRGYWVPGVSCVPTGWVGGVVVTSSQPIVAVGRPHIAEQVTTYDGFTSGSTTSYIPMLFKDAFGGSYDSALYIQNTEASAAVVTIKFYDSSGALTCTRYDSVPSLSTLGLWLPSTTCSP